METIEKKTHLRSSSLPSATHPLVSQFEEHLKRLMRSEATLLSSSSVRHKLNDMLDLHDCTDKLLQLSIEQKALAQECNFKCADNLLQGSLRLLDICSTAKDCLLQSKESICDLKSIIQRRKGKETGFTVEGVKYLALRKQMKKKVRKALQNMKNELLASSKNDNNTSPMLSFLKETEAVTLSSLEHLLLFISGSKGHSKHSRWSTISKLVQPKE
ncbi:hypothetical protein Fmac_022400 [Flemingia macrophylla]|uniref:Uncharacterized protein n=1 Tax=Flemingia macrophylla TaxID=520843 RepID=A0ABD1LZM4_9FABA